MKHATMKVTLSTLIAEAIKARQAPDSYAFLPEIIDSLTAMERSLDLDVERRSRMAGALERLVTEDFAFSEGSLGRALLRVANDFASE
jgi:hypothetical protein